jgi:aryl-alcohol dehydrogenase-like predicted oxidoreductase
MPANHTLQKRRLGQTDIEITPIGSGGNQFTGTRGMYRVMGPDLSQEQINAIIQAALDGGMTWFDTAEMYGSGQSERALASALKAAGKQDNEVVVATKWSPFFRTAGNIPRTIDDRSRFLGGYTIDLYMVHQPLGFSSREAEMKAMADLVEAGKIRSVGVSNFNVEQMQRAHAALERRGLPLAANQVQYSLLQRKIESNGVLDAAKELGVTIIAWMPLASGVLTGKFHREPEQIRRKPLARRMMAQRFIERGRPVINALEEIAAKYHATPAQVALNWLVTFHGETVVAIPGASKAHHAQQNAEAMNFRLRDEDMARLDDISRAFR